VPTAKHAGYQVIFFKASAPIFKGKLSNKYVTSVERCEPAAASVGGGRDTKRRGDVPASRKRAASSDAAVE